MLLDCFLQRKNNATRDIQSYRDPYEIPDELLKFEVSLGHKQLGEVDTMSSMHYEIVDTSNPAYANCQSICDIEARFERLRNYQINADEVTFLQCKFKVLTVEILEES